MALVRASQQTSSSNTSRYCNYHVFLSFRGEDTRKTFTDHLYTALVNAGFRTFRDDDELERGEDIKLELEKAIKQSRTSVIVFSKDYASSRWCLDELVMILEERKRTSGDHVVLPVFYDVDPSHVRKQTGSLAKAFSTHQKTQSLRKVKNWKEALAEVADLAGMVLQNQADGYESKFIMKIVKVIGDKLRRTPLSVAPNLVGMHSRCRNINRWLQDRSTDIGILVIYGMSGIGKTTIAKSVYNKNFRRFEGSSFLENITEVSRQPTGLVQIQKQLLSDILNGRKVKIHSVSEGITKIEDFICSKRVLLVLDDVDHAHQLDAILRMKDRFHPGTKIIITTKHAKLLKVHDQVTEVHKVGTLDDKQSLELFSWHAFGKNHPTEDYVKYSKKVVHHCGGLPLALEVLGSSLLGENLEVWKSALQKLEVIPNREILNKLRISYDSLQDDHDRNLFLHISCFFIGKDKDHLVRILDGCDFYTVIGIQNLIDRCLMTIDERNKVQMHDMILDMGRGIVRLESEEPGERSRLWHHKDSFRVLREMSGTQKIEGLVLDMYMYLKNSPISSNEAIFEANAFAMMHKLKLLHLSHVQLDACYAKFPTGLRWLCWLGFPLDSIPIDFPLKSLIVLEMQHSSLTLVCKGKQHLPSLKILDLSHSHDLTGTAEFSFCPNLEKLILVDCTRLIGIHESIGNLERLVYLNIKDCKTLRKLPKNTFMLKLLETLIVSGCESLSQLSIAMIRNMESLKMLEADGIPIRDLWPERSSCILSSLPCSLVALSLGGCNLSDDAFPTDFSNLSSLQKLNLNNNPICSLPNCIKGLMRLKGLDFSNCTRLKSLVELPKVDRLYLAGCIALEKVTYQSHWCQVKYINVVDSNHNLVEWEYSYKIEPIVRVDGEMINLLGLCNLESMATIQMYKRNWLIKGDYSSPVQGLYQHGIFSTFFSGNEVPGRFSHKSRASSVSFIVPLLCSRRIRGLNVFVVYANSVNDSPPVFGDDRGYYYSIRIRINNNTKGLRWIYAPNFYGIPGEGEDMIWLSHWTLEDQLEGGDEASVSVLTKPWLQVKECGIQIVQEEEEKMGIQHNITDPMKDLDASGMIWYKFFIADSDEDTGVFDSDEDTGVFDSDEDTENKEEEQQDDQTIAATRGRNNWSLSGRKVLIMAAGFFLSLSIFAILLYLLALLCDRKNREREIHGFTVPT